MDTEQNQSEEQKKLAADKLENERLENEKQYIELRNEYKAVSNKVLVAASIVLGVIMVFLLVNRFCLPENMLTGPQYFFLFLSIITLCISIGLHFQYNRLLKDPVSELSKNIILFVPGKSKTLPERIAKNRKMVHNMAVTLWIGFLLLFGVLLLGLIPSCNSTPGCEKPAQVTDDGKIVVDFLQVNDVYEIASLESGKIGGLARVATLKKDCLKNNPNTLLVIAGDFLSPSVFNSIKDGDGESLGGKQMIETMNATGFDLAIFGNHEFDISKKDLQKRINESSFEWVASNVHNILSDNGKRTGLSPFKKNGNDIPGYLVKTFTDSDGTIANIGFIALTIPTKIKDTLFASFDSTIEAAKIVYNEIKNTCDAVIAITHQSMDDDKKLAAAIPQLALIIGGHEHDMQYAKLGNVVITKAHSNAKSAFILKVTIDKRNRKITVIPELKKVDSTVAKDFLIESIAEKWTEQAYQYFKRSGFNPNTSLP